MDPMGIVSNIVGLVVGTAGLVAFLMPRIRGVRRRGMLCRFWGRRGGGHKRVLIYYPGYPNPRVGRTEEPSGYYLSEDDARAADVLKHALGRLGYECEPVMVAESPEADDPFSDEAIHVLLCSPKLDPITHSVVYDPWVGGNALSSYFYLRQHLRLGITLRFSGGRKEYQLPGLAISSPMDDIHPRNEDCGLLIRFVEGNRVFVLCWGIHAPATLGAVRAALDPKALRAMPLRTDSVYAVISVECDGEDREASVVSAGPLRIRSVPPAEKRDPFRVAATLSLERPVFGLSYLWATPTNVEAVKLGEYDRLRPVAAELDLSLECTYSCPWCAYRGSRGSGGILHDGARARSMVEMLHSWGIRLLVLTGGGEPLLSQAVERVVEECAKRGMWVTLYTNGYLLDEIRAFGLMARGVSEIRLSIDDASSSQNYREAHTAPPGALDRVMANSRKLLDLRRRNGFNTRIGMSLLVSDLTITRLEQTAEKLREWVDQVGPFDYAVIRPAVLYWPGSQEEPQHVTVDAERMGQVWRSARALRDSGVVRHALVSRQRFEEVQAGPSCPDYERCLAAPLWLNIGPDGAVYLCCETKHRDGYDIGNVLCGDLDALLSHGHFARRRRETLRADECPMRMCKPSAINRLLNEVESRRRVSVGGELPSEVTQWLDGLCEYNQKSPSGSTIIPSVSGTYEELP